jgi:hypothetical protein
LLPVAQADVTGPSPEGPDLSDAPAGKDNNLPPDAPTGPNDQNTEGSSRALPEAPKEIGDSAFEPQKEVDRREERTDEPLPEGSEEPEGRNSADENPPVAFGDAARATFLPEGHLPTSPAVGPFSAKLASIRATHAMQVGATLARARAERSRNVMLKEGVAAAARDLAAAECARFDRLRHEFEYLRALNDAATFVFAALDKRFGRVPEADAIGRTRCALAAIIRKLATIRVSRPAPRGPAPPDRVNAAVQTEWLPPVVAPISARMNPRKSRPKICTPARSSRVVRVGSVP